MTQKSFIKLTNVSKVFKSEHGSQILFQNLNAQFEQGTAYAITGISGTGKTTLLSLIAGIDTPTSGSILFDGKDVADSAKNNSKVFFGSTIGLVFQSPYLLNELSVLENVIIKGLITHDNHHNLNIRGMELLKAVGLEHKAHTNPVLLSGGERARVALARALFVPPVFLLADEPTAHLDEINKKIIIDCMLHYTHMYGMGLIITSHDPVVVASMSERLTVVNGQLHAL